MTRPRCACSPACTKASTAHSIYAQHHNPRSEARKVKAESVQDQREWGYAVQKLNSKRAQAGKGK